MFLPLFVALWLLLLTVGSTGLTAQRGRSEAQLAAWTVVEGSNPKGQLALIETGDQWSHLLPDNDPRLVDAGLVSANGYFKPDVFLPEFNAKLPEGVRTTQVMQNHWDHQMIKFPTKQFPTEQSEQLPLTLSPLAQRFARDREGRLITSALLDVGTQP